MTQEFEKLIEVAEFWGSSTHPCDESRFKNFLNFAKSSGEAPLSENNFIAAFEEGNNKERLTKDREKMVKKLYKKYQSIKKLI